MSEDNIVQLDEFDAPYGRQVKLEAVDFESGLSMLRLRIREGNRFTILDIDENTARHWGTAMCSWADKIGMQDS
jgi:hypothetical protein